METTTVENRIIDSGIALEHVKNWTPVEALRELIQNYVDVINDYNALGCISWENGFAHITDDGPGLSMKSLAFGFNDKTSYSIGQFGEGMKSGLVTLIRVDRSVEIYTGDTIIIPRVRPSENFGGLLTLHYHIEPASKYFKGTEMFIECTEEELNEAKQYFVMFQNTTWLEDNIISKPGGQIYVNGSRIATIEDGLFSYHLKGETAQDIVTRDRENTKDELMNPLIEEILSNTECEEVIEAILSSIIEIQPSYETRLNIRPEWGDETWKGVWDRMFGDRTIVSSNEGADNKAKYLGYTVIRSLSWRQQTLLERIGVKNAITIVKEHNRTGDVYAIDELNPEERENLMWAWKLINFYHYSVNLNDIIITDFADGTFGAYDHDLDQIKLSRFILTNKNKTLGILFHESIHRSTGADDETKEFEKGLLEVLVKVILENEEE